MPFGFVCSPWFAVAGLCDREVPAPLLHISLGHRMVTVGENSRRGISRRDTYMYNSPVTGNDTAMAIKNDVQKDK